MKRAVRFIVILALLMVGTLGAWAQHVESGTAMKGNGLVKLNFSFSGGEIKKKEVRDNKYCYECDVYEGAEITISANLAAAPKGIEEVRLFHRFLHTYDTENIIKEAKGSIKYQYKVTSSDSGGLETDVTVMGTNTLYYLHIKWNVIKKPNTPTSPTTTTPPKKCECDDTFGESIKNHLAKMSYAISGGKVIEAEKTPMEVFNISHYITCETESGCTIRCLNKLVKGNGNGFRGKGPLQLRIGVYQGHKVLFKKALNSYKACDISYTIPKGATEVVVEMFLWQWINHKIILGEDHGDAFKLYCRVIYKVKDGTPIPARTVTQSVDDCGCDEKPQGNRVNSGIWIDNMIGIHAWIRPNWETDVSYREMNPSTTIYECDRIKTEGISYGTSLCLRWDRYGEIYINYNTTFVIKSREVPQKDPPKVSVLEGIATFIFRSKEKSEAELEAERFEYMVKGTIYTIEETGTSSNLYLYAGSVELTTKKTKKKYTLKPGESVSVGDDGKIVVKKFNLEQTASKFGVPMSEISNHYSNTGMETETGTGTGAMTISTKRYGVERALVKYKVTTGTAQGVMAKVFDKYGQQERRELKMGNQTTLQLTQGNTSYNLDRQTKTYQQVTNAELNFLNMNAPVMQKLKLKKKGTAKVLNRECTIYANSDTEFYVWKGIVLKKVAHTKKGTTTTEATSVELPASVDSKYFNMPSGYTIKN